MTHFRTIRLLIFAFAFGGLLSAEQAVGGNPPEGIEVCFEGQLVWGTNDDPKLHPQYKEVDAGSRKILDSLKWKHYLVTQKKDFCLKPGEQKEVEMSDKCSIIARHKGKESTGKGDPQIIALTLMGDGKPIAKHTKAVSENHTIALGGSLKNGTAWAVLLKRVPAKSVDKK